MRLDRLRHGELAALVTAPLLLLVMCLDWYDAVPGAPHRTGWTATGWFAAGATGLALLACAIWVVATVTQPSPAVPLIASIVTIVFGVFASIALAARLLLQPGLGAELGNAEVDLGWAAYIGPLLAIALTTAACRGLADERTDAPYNQPGDIELRPLPE